VLNCHGRKKQIPIIEGGKFMDSIVIPQVDNDIFNSQSESWWSDNGLGAIIRCICNPWRVPYFQRILKQKFENSHGKRLLDLGCGGGLLAEEFTLMGFDVTGIDPSDKLIEVARSHAAQSGLKINYLTGNGDKLPYENETFEVVACCDVLDHVQEWDTVIGEIARVLKPDGIFIYDTINRTDYSKAVMIDLAQENEATRFLPPNLHAWEMFIKPEELGASLERYGLQNIDLMGVVPVEDPTPMVMVMQKHNAGEISTIEFAKYLHMEEGPFIDGFYKGYAIKP
jgi:2-polyprenyl-6-hydroxyphenyl methylase/3-demethylubiquinone-9 3-methyltransferase